MTVWKINGVTFASLGISLVAGAFRTHGISSVTLRRETAFDSAEPEGLGYDDEVVISYSVDGGAEQVYFRGKVTSVPKAGSDSSEHHEIVIEDAWAMLDNTVYQESWAVGGITYDIPRCVFGMDAAGATRNVGGIIRAAVEFAGVATDFSVTGEVPIPSEITNQTCAEIVDQAIRLHPDWQPWIDHTTEGAVTFKVTALADAEAINLAVDGSGGVPNFSIVRRDDLMPLAVRIVYESAAEVDGEVFRKFYVDKYPADGPDSGPRILQCFIPLAGVQAQIQKARIYSETVPTDGYGDAAKAWVKKRWPQLNDVDDAHWDMANFGKTLVPEPSDMGDSPVSNDARRRVAESVSQIPRELVQGSAEDWMRLRIGKVKVQFQAIANGGATVAEKAILGSVAPLTFTCTDAPAGAKIYKGLSNWAPAEAIPTGIAESVYKAITSAMAYQGSVSTVDTDVPLVNPCGKKLNLTGGLAEWATMGAPISAMNWDLVSGTASYEFGPPRHLMPQDFLELQRILRFRPVKWFSRDERVSDKHGAPSGSASAAGDTVLPFDFPGAGANGVVCPGGRDANVYIRWIAWDCDTGFSLSRTDVLFFRKGSLVETITATDPWSPPNHIDGYEETMPSGCFETWANYLGWEPGPDPGYSGGY